MSDTSNSRSRSRSRTIHALRAATVHLLVSAVVAAVIAALVFGVWFPAPLRELVGGTGLFWLIVGVDVVCGPLLTMVVFNPKKPRAELARDLTIVALLQVLALGYGVHTLAYARPVAQVFEVDRFRVVTISDLEEGEAAAAPAWAKPWRFGRVRTIGLRPVNGSAEMLASIDASLQGVEPSQRPSWWQDYTLNKKNVLARARPVADLRASHPNQGDLLEAAVASAIANMQPSETTDADALLFLPLVSRQVMDWVVLLDPVTARIRGYAHLDGFE